MTHPLPRKLDFFLLETIGCSSPFNIAIISPMAGLRDSSLVTQAAAASIIRAIWFEFLEVHLSRGSNSSSIAPLPLSRRGFAWKMCRMRCLAILFTILLQLSQNRIQTWNIIKSHFAIVANHVTLRSQEMWRIKTWIRRKIRAQVLSYILLS